MTVAAIVAAQTRTGGMIALPIVALCILCGLSVMTMIADPLTFADIFSST